MTRGRLRIRRRVTSKAMYTARQCIRHRIRPVRLTWHKQASHVLHCAAGYIVFAVAASTQREVWRVAPPCFSNLRKLPDNGYLGMVAHGKVGGWGTGARFGVGGKAEGRRLRSMRMYARNSRGAFAFWDTHQPNHGSYDVTRAAAIPVSSRTLSYADGVCGRALSYLG